MRGRRPGPAAIADVLARLVEKSLVAVDERVVARAALPPAGDRAPVRARAPGRGGRDPALAMLRHASWACAGRGGGSSPRLDRDAANMRGRWGPCWSARPGEALRFCAALLPFWLRRIDLGEARQRFDEALAAAPERTAVRARALLAAAAIDYRSGVLPGGLAQAEEARRWPPRSATPARSGARSSSWGSLGGDARHRSRGPVDRAGAGAGPARGPAGPGGDRHLLARGGPLAAGDLGAPTSSSRAGHRAARARRAGRPSRLPPR